jgi:pimeloyl-ACP methyl ester carboxylesterase
MNRILLLLFLMVTHFSYSQVKYGSNSDAGRYLTVNDAKIYYEVYGEGPPLLLLHGDVFGYIDEFSDCIPLLSKHYRVIAMGMRGHGRSEIGSQPFSYKLFAEDALAILKKESVDTVVVVGFSAGAVISYYMAAHYPAVVRKIAALGGGLGSFGFKKDKVGELRSMNIDSLEKKYPKFIKSRREIMVEPGRYQELVDRLKKTWFMNNYVEPEKVRSIHCPSLIVGGDRDTYLDITSFVSTYKTIPGSQLAVIPNCDHVGLITKPYIFSDLVIPFLLGK